MAGRRTSGLAEHLMELVARMPWWAGCALALVSYVVLHQIARHQVAGVVTPGQVATSVAPMVWRTLATIGQYLIPFLCLVGAATSAYRRYQRKTLMAGVVGRTTADALNGMSWQEFEKLVGEAFRLQGYQVTERGGDGPDGGIDLVLRKGQEKYLVQCKQWKAFSVGVSVVRELYGVMAATGAAGGFIVTSGRFTENAKAFAEGRNVKLIDGPRLFGLLKQATAERGAAMQTEIYPRQEPKFTEAISPPACPLCSKPMVKRTAARGRTAGASFWGCSGYPACKGTRQIA